MSRPLDYRIILILIRSAIERVFRVTITRVRVYSTHGPQPMTDHVKRDMIDDG